MTGYEEFQMIMAEINRKKTQTQNGKISDDDIVKNLKDLFGI